MDVHTRYTSKWWHFAKHLFSTYLWYMNTLLVSPSLKLSSTSYNMFTELGYQVHYDYLPHGVCIRCQYEPTMTQKGGLTDSTAGWRHQMNLIMFIYRLLIVTRQVCLVSSDKLRCCQRKSPRVMEAKIHKFWSKWLMFYGHFCARGRLKRGRASSMGNEAKSKMKHPSDMPSPRFELRW